MSVQRDIHSAKNQSAVKALDIFEVMANNPDPMRLQDISKQLGMSASTVLRFLVSLESCGYVRQNPDTLKYYLTFKICSIANKVSENFHLYDIAMPFMKNIAGKYNESVCLTVEQDMSVVYIGVLQQTNQMLRITQRVGNRVPMHCTGSGKLLLTSHNEEFIDKIVAIKGLPSFTSNTITDKQLLLKELEEVRRRDYALDREECEVGSNCIAAPIRDFSNKIIAAISVTGPATRLTEEKMKENLEYFMEQIKDLSGVLGYEQ